MTKQLLIGILATFLTFGLLGTAFGSNLISPHGSEAGQWMHDFNAPVTDADKAASNHDYDRDLLAQVGTEAGVNEVRETPDADLAAQNRDYDRSRLAEVGTEAGILCASC